MRANDLTAYLIPLRDDVRVLSDAGYVTRAQKLIDFLLREGKVDGLQRERLLLEAHRLPVFLRDYPFDEERWMPKRFPCYVARERSLGRWWMGKSICTGASWTPWTRARTLRNARPTCN